MAVLERAVARLRRIWPWALGLTVAAVGLSVLAGRFRALRTAEDSAYDLRLTSFAPPPVRIPDFTILAVDDTPVQGIRANETYARAWGNWPYARSLWARVLTHLETMGARAVVLDFTFDEQSSDPGQDALLRETVQRLSIPLAVGFSVNVPSQQGQPLPS